MANSRPHLLIFLLAATPIALLAWLGTYLIRDAAHRSEVTTQAVLAERLAVVDHQLADDLRQLTDWLDSQWQRFSDDQQAFARHLGDQSWVEETWIVSSDGEVTRVTSKNTAKPTADGLAEPRSKAIQQAIGSISTHQQTRLSSGDQSNWAFRPAPGNVVLTEDRSRQAVWQTFIKTSTYHLIPARSESVSISGWHVTDGDFIYWQRFSNGSVCCARMPREGLLPILFDRIPMPGLALFPGRLTLVTTTGIPLHTWGREDYGSDGKAAAQRRCGAPFTQWELSYTPSAGEFPEPYLFPILLGVGSGSVLVLALAWMSSRESARELRVAQQRVTFVNQVSHELRTPLTNIRLYAEMAHHRAEKAGDIIAQRHLGVVETETTRLNRLIQNVLNYARQQRDKLTVQPKEVALDDVLKRAITAWRPLLESKGFEIDLKLQGPDQIKVDADAVEQIVGNLISNVDKYASHGKWIGIRTETDEENARIIVEDRGPGIPAGKRKAVFEAFERLRSDLTEGVSGTGIGLTISRELADLHGGSLRVCSVYRDGARFILTLPLKSA